MMSPRTKLNKTPIRPMVMLMRAPYSTRESTSRPSLSVPSR